MKLRKTTIGGMAATLLFAAGCGSGGGGMATGGSGGVAGSGAGGKATGGSGGSATGGSGTGGATGGAGGATGGAGGATGGAGGATGGAGGATGGAGGATGGAGGATGGAGGATGGTGGATGGAGGGGVGGTAWLTLPVVPPALAVPLGATLAIHDHGSGVQIYTCTPSGGAGGAAGSGADAGAITYSWVLKGPDAKLYDVNSVQVGTHGIGPEWTSSDGSVVNGTKVEQVNAPATATNAIPWLLLRASSTTGTGVFSNVTYVQRVNTSGGAAPATGCDASTSGTDTSVSYTAEYYFYTGGGAAAWLTPPASVPAAIAVPSGSTLAIHDHGVGTQIYTCTASGGAGGAGGSGADAGAVTYSWVLKGPSAILSDASFAQVGTHGVGPTWTSTDGSMIGGTKLAQLNSPASDAIPWLLLKATSTGGAGVFANVTSVQRLNTTGGAAPSDGCGASTVSTETSVSYSADYYFYTGGTGAGGASGTSG